MHRTYTKKMLSFYKLCISHIFSFFGSSKSEIKQKGKKRVKRIVPPIFFTWCTSKFSYIPLLFLLIPSKTLTSSFPYLHGYINHHKFVPHPHSPPPHVML